MGAERVGYGGRRLKLKDTDIGRQAAFDYKNGEPLPKGNEVISQMLLGLIQGWRRFVTPPMERS